MFCCSYQRGFWRIMNFTCSSLSCITVLVLELGLCTVFVGGMECTLVSLWMTPRKEWLISWRAGLASTQQAQSGLKDPQKLPLGQVKSKPCTSSCRQAGWEHLWAKRPEDPGEQRAEHGPATCLWPGSSCVNPAWEADKLGDLSTVPLSWEGT